MKNEKGITLLALIIIVVLLITLAGISAMFVLKNEKSSNNGQTVNYEDIELEEDIDYEDELDEEDEIDEEDYSDEEDYDELVDEEMDEIIIPGEEIDETTDNTSVNSIVDEDKVVETEEVQ